jgi:hypothetical protein
MPKVCSSFEEGTNGPLSGTPLDQLNFVEAMSGVLLNLSSRDSKLLEAFVGNKP